MKTDVKINGSWYLPGYIDTYYTGNNHTLKIVTLYIVLINRVIIVWHSLSQKTVSLFVTEANIHKSRMYVEK